MIKTPHSATASTRLWKTQIKNKVISKQKAWWQLNAVKHARHCGDHGDWLIYGRKSSACTYDFPSSENPVFGGWNRCRNWNDLKNGSVDTETLGKKTAQAAAWKQLPAGTVIKIMFQYFKPPWDASNNVSHCFWMNYEAILCLDVQNKLSKMQHPDVVWSL